MHGSGDSRVSVNRKVMVVANDSSSLFCVSGYYFAVILPPFPVMLFEIVGVNPRFKGRLILIWGFGGSCIDKQGVGKYRHVFIIMLALVIVSASR